MTRNNKLKTYDFSNRDLYNPVYIKLFKNKSRFLHLFGSAGSGKSVFGCQKEIVLSFDSNRRRRRTLVVRKVYTTLVNSIYSELKKVIYEWNLADCFEMLKSPLSITNKITGVSFIFAGLDDVEKIKSVSGVDRIFIEEATELTSMSELDQLSLRLRGFQEVQITLAYNPVNVHHWLNTEIHEKLPPDHCIFKTTYLDNVKLLAKDPNYALSIERLAITNPNYHRVYGLGFWGQNQEGLIYPDYKVVPMMPDDDFDFYGLDFGYNDPTAMIAGKIVDTYGSEKKDLFVEEILYETGHTSESLVKTFDEKGIDKRKAIVADSAASAMIRSLRNAGYNVIECEKYPGSVVEGIKEVKNYNINIVAGAKDLIKEIQNHSWKNKNGVWLDDEPNDSVNHALDAMRYGVVLNSPSRRVRESRKGALAKAMSSRKTLKR